MKKVVMGAAGGEAECECNEPWPEILRMCFSSIPKRDGEERRLNS